MQNTYRTAIIQTLAYFELFDMPLKAFELERFLYWPHREAPETKKIKEALRQMIAKGEVVQFEDYYSLEADIKEQVGLRKVRRERSLKWLKRAKPWLTVLAAWPGVEMIAICNNLAFLVAKESSDIDLLVVTKSGRIWQTRFFLAAFLQVFKKRTTPKSNDKEKFCLSFFLSSDHLDLAAIVLEEDDIYLQYWMASLMPVYDPMNKKQALLKKNHALAHRVVRDTRVKEEAFLKVNDTSLLFRLLEFFTNQTSWAPEWLEAKTKAWQEKHFTPEIKNALKEKNSHVIANEQMLKFHTNDRRQQFLDRWKNRCDLLLKN